ncbi:g4259 [Coccomyxa viridis]|uniref:G4259 protein n=1 Tax=Coccomyxa viridis TaxID=1274662 RepID=A0ABP1FV59_9CHLO
MHNSRHAAALVVAAILFACTSGASLPSRGATLPQQAVGSVAWLLTNINSQEPMYTSLWTRSKELFRQVLQQNTDAVKSAASELSALQNATGSREPDNATRVAMHMRHGNTPKWFLGQGAEGGRVAKKEGYRRVLRRQKANQRNTEDQWLRCHRRYVAELQSNTASSAPWDVLFYGDSIMESWRGTFLGMPWGPFQKVLPIWEGNFERQPYKSHALGIAGDKAEHLLWRLENGELPSGARHPKIVGVMIGTNDLVDNCTMQHADQTAQSILDVYHLLHTKLPNTHILSLAILPKGETWPNRCSDAILSVNIQLQAFAELNPGYVHFVDVGIAFLGDALVGGKKDVSEALMPDSLHPSSVGMRILATRLEPIIRRLISTPAIASLDRVAVV